MTFEVRTVMDSLELNRKVREILLTVTPETSLQATAALAALGFGPRAAFLIVCRVLEVRILHGGQLSGANEVSE